MRVRLELEEGEREFCIEYNCDLALDPEEVMHLAVSQIIMMKNSNPLAG